MSLKDILVHVDLSDSCPERLKVGLSLAARFDAHLTALFVVSRPSIPGFLESSLGEDLIREQTQKLFDAASDLKAQFEKMAKAYDVKVEWRQCSGDLVSNLLIQSRYADLTILGQTCEDQIDAPGAGELPDGILLRSGRPVIVVPNEGTFETIGTRIVVAWDASRLASRALNDGLSIMEKSDQVDVLVVDPETTRGYAKHEPSPGADMSLHLARHDINATAEHVNSQGKSPGDALMAYAESKNADLIIMGGYGHKRWREVVLGGVTRYMLQNMKIPVFMSH